MRTDVSTVLVEDNNLNKKNLILLKHEQKSFVPFNGSFSDSGRNNKICLLKNQSMTFDFLSSREYSYLSNLVYSINSTERLLPTVLHNLSIVINFSKMRRYRKQFVTYIIFNRKRNLIIRKKRNIKVSAFRRI